MTLPPGDLGQALTGLLAAVRAEQDGRAEAERELASARRELHLLGNELEKEREFRRAAEAELAALRVQRAGGGAAGEGDAGAVPPPSSTGGSFSALPAGCPGTGRGGVSDDGSDWEEEMDGRGGSGVAVGRAADGGAAAIGAMGARGAEANGAHPSTEASPLKPGLALDRAGPAGASLARPSPAVPSPPPTSGHFAGARLPPHARPRRSQTEPSPYSRTVGARPGAATSVSVSAPVPDPVAERLSSAAAELAALRAALVSSERRQRDGLSIGELARMLDRAIHIQESTVRAYEGGSFSHGRTLDIDGEGTEDELGGDVPSGDGATRGGTAAGRGSADGAGDDAGDGTGEAVSARLAAGAAAPTATPAAPPYASSGPSAERPGSPAAVASAVSGSTPASSTTLTSGSELSSASTSSADLEGRTDAAAGTREIPAPPGARSPRAPTPAPAAPSEGVRAAALTARPPQPPGKRAAMVEPPVLSPARRLPSASGPSGGEVSLADDGAAGVGATAAAVMSVALARSWAVSGRRAAQGSPGGRARFRLVAAVPRSAQSALQHCAGGPLASQVAGSTPGGAPLSHLGGAEGRLRDRRLAAAGPRGPGGLVPRPSSQPHLLPRGMPPTESTVALQSLADAAPSALDESQEAAWRAYGSHLKLHWLSRPRTVLLCAKPTCSVLVTAGAAAAWLLRSGLVVYVEPAEHPAVSRAAARALARWSASEAPLGGGTGGGGGEEGPAGLGCPDPPDDAFGSDSSDFEDLSDEEARDGAGTKTEDYWLDLGATPGRPGRGSGGATGAGERARRPAPPRVGVGVGRDGSAKSMPRGRQARSGWDGARGAWRETLPRRTSRLRASAVDLGAGLLTWRRGEAAEEAAELARTSCKARGGDADSCRASSARAGLAGGVGAADLDAHLPSRVRDRIDAVVTLGGDGTLLWACSLFGERAVPPVASFAMGSLGFMTPFPRAALRTVLGRALSTDADFPLMLRHRLHARVLRSKPSGAEASSGGGASGDVSAEGGSPTSGSPPPRSDGVAAAAAAFHPPLEERGVVLNELVIDRGQAASLTALEVYADRSFVTVIAGDGLILATPTGSTAYNLAAGGSMIHPGVPAILFTPICPHTLASRPLVFPEHVTITVKVSRDSRSGAYVSFDGKGRVHLDPGDSVAVHTSEWPVPTVCNLDASHDWFMSVRDGLNWNVRAPQNGEGLVDGVGAF